MVHYETNGRCAIITIDRPEARNAIDPDAARGLEAGLDRAEGDPDVWVGVLAGVPPVFCAGADLKAIGAGRATELSTERGGFAGIVRRARIKPLIAAVDGPALAGGMELALACDLIVASTTARFGIPEVKRGLVAAAGGLFRLGRKLPLNVAMECAVTGDPIPAELAHRHGLVNALCEPGEARDAALALAERISVNAPLAVRESRTVMLEATYEPDDVGWERTDAGSAVVMASADMQEGVGAFVEKREPVWIGR